MVEGELLISAVFVPEGEDGAHPVLVEMVVASSFTVGSGFTVGVRALDAFSGERFHDEEYSRSQAASAAWGKILGPEVWEGGSA